MFSHRRLKFSISTTQNINGSSSYIRKTKYTRQSFSPGTPVSSINKTDCHDIAEILLKVAFNTIKQTNTHSYAPARYNLDKYTTVQGSNKIIRLHEFLQTAIDKKVSGHLGTWTSRYWKFRYWIIKIISLNLKTF